MNHGAYRHYTQVLDTQGWSPDDPLPSYFTFGDLTSSESLACQGFKRFPERGRTRYERDDEPDSEIVVYHTPIPTYVRPMVTVTLVGGWYPVVRVSFIVTNSPEQGPAYLLRSTHTRPQSEQPNE